MTEYQRAVADHMADAPEELRDYVRGRLKDSVEYLYRSSPMLYCGFSWSFSKEDEDFWKAIHEKRWTRAMDTDFWKSRQKAKPTQEWQSDSRALVNNNDLRQQLADARLQLANVQKKCGDLEARLRSIQNLSDI